MNILYVCSKSLKDSQTGAATQMRETCAALIKAGATIKRVFYSSNPIIYEDDDGRLIFEKDLLQFVDESDVVHFIYCTRRIVRAWIKYHTKPFFGSTVFWSGRERVLVAWQTYPKILERLKMVKYYAHFLVPKLQSFNGVDIFLPNTQAEGERFLRSYRVDRNSYCFPVPNGFKVPSFDISDVARIRGIPECEYIVVPGIFASRKNQLGLIRALKDSKYNVVFMGGVIAGNVDYYDACRREANERMHFIGYINSESKDYWSILRHARCACLASDCETPGVAMLEAAYAGARPIITRFGGTVEYFGFDAEYLKPWSKKNIRNAVDQGWARGRLGQIESAQYARYSWAYCAEMTLSAYKLGMSRFRMNDCL